MGSTPTIFLARSFITMDDATPRATAVAAQDGEIVAIGELDDVVATVGDDHEVDETFADNTVITGADQHLHPFGGEHPDDRDHCTEDWVMPDRGTLPQPPRVSLMNGWHLLTNVSMMASGCSLGVTTRCGTVNSAVSDLMAWLSTAPVRFATVGT